MAEAKKKKKNKKGKQYGARLSNDQRLLDAAENGNLDLVEQLLENATDLNVHCTDFLGRTPLRLATESEQEEVVQAFLNKFHQDGRPEDYLAVYECFLQSISTDAEDVAEVILKHPIYDYIRPEDMTLMLHGDSQFSADITPLSLAAEKNLVEIVSMLIKKGERIHKPHSFTCDCQKCRGEQSLDELRFTRSRLNAYRGLASPSYIAILSEVLGHDPFLAAFELANELRTVAKQEKHVATEYKELASNLSQFCVALLDHVRGNDELDIILNQIGECTGCPGGRQEDLIRITQAIKYKEKNFVAHPSCQKKLGSIWYGNVRIWERTPFWLQPFLVLCFIAMYPVLAMMFWFTPLPRIVEFMRTPFVKFVAHSSSFIVFLIIVLSFSWTESAEGESQGTKIMNAVLDYYSMYHKNMSDVLGTSYFDNPVLNIRPHFPGLIQITLCCWLLGLVWNEVKQVYYSGLTEYLSSLFNVMDTVSLALYIASFTLRFITYGKTYFVIEKFSKADPWLLMLESDRDTIYHYYWLVADRFYWRADDPYIIAEGLFAIANVLSFFRLFNLLAMSDQLGPLQVSLERMISDIMKFTMIFAIVFLAFLVGFNNLYWYYDKTQREKVQAVDHVGEATVQAEEAFGTMLDAFRTLMFALFGLGDADVVELNEVYDNSQFTEVVGYSLLGVFNWVAVVVLMNMLIAIMSMSFDRIQQDADVEWKFSKTVLYMEFIDTGTTLAVPLNVIPSPKSIVRLIITPIQVCYRKLCKRQQRPASQNNNNGEVQRMDEFSRANEAYEPEISETRTDETTEDSSAGASMPRVPSLPTLKGMKERIIEISEKVLDEQISVNPSKNEELTLEVVMKRVIRRYIFDKGDSDNAESQEVEELKQDISSFRFEVLNQIGTQQDLLIKLLQATQPIAPPRPARRASKAPFGDSDDGDEDDEDEEEDSCISVGGRSRFQNRKLQALMKKQVQFKRDVLTLSEKSIQTDDLRPPTPPPPPPETMDASISTDLLQADIEVQTSPVASEPESESEPETEPALESEVYAPLNSRRSSSLTAEEKVAKYNLGALVNLGFDMDLIHLVAEELSESDSGDEQMITEGRVRNMVRKLEALQNESAGLSPKPHIETAPALRKFSPPDSPKPSTPETVPSEQSESQDAAQSSGLPSSEVTNPKAEQSDSNLGAQQRAKPDRLDTPRRRSHPGRSRVSSGEQDVHSWSVSDDEAIHI